MKRKRIQFCWITWEVCEIQAESESCIGEHSEEDIDQETYLAGALTTNPIASITNRRGLGGRVCARCGKHFVTEACLEEHDRGAHEQNSTSTGDYSWRKECLRKM